jgi:hypothetical protein
MTDPVILAQDLRHGWSMSRQERGLSAPTPWQDMSKGEQAHWFSFAEAVIGNEQREVFR